MYSGSGRILLGKLNSPWTWCVSVSVLVTKNAKSHMLTINKMDLDLCVPLPILTRLLNILFFLVTKSRFQVFKASKGCRSRFKASVWTFHFPNSGNWGHAFPGTRNTNFTFTLLWWICTSQRNENTFIYQHVFLVDFATNRERWISNVWTSILFSFSFVGKSSEYK